MTRPASLILRYHTILSPHAIHNIYLTPSEPSYFESLTFTMSSEWCSTCRNLDFCCPLQWPEDRWSYPPRGHPQRQISFAFESALAEVETSASSGCLLCAIVLEAILFFWEAMEVSNPTVSIKTSAEGNPQICLDVFPQSFVQLYTPSGKRPE